MKVFALISSLAKQSFSSSATYLLLIALTLAVSATTALKFSHSQIRDAINLQAAEMQAADMVLSDHVPIAAQWQKLAQDLKLQQSQVTLFNGMAYKDSQFVMVNVKAIQDNFPLRGVLQVQPAQQKLASGEVWLSPRAAELLKVAVGEQVHIVDATFKVTAIIQRDSNQELGFSAFSPTVLISQLDLAKTNAVQQGSRVESRLLLAGPTTQLTAFKRQFKAQQKQPLAEETIAQGESDSAAAAAPAKQEKPRLRTADQANTRLVKPIDHLNTYLQLVNILTLLLCGIAIALSCHRYLQQNQEDIALLRCMGASRGQILVAYLLLLSMIVSVGIILGGGLGVIFSYGLLNMLQHLVPQIQLSFTFGIIWLQPMVMAILTSVSLLLGFVLPSLWQLVNTSPAKVLRPARINLKSMFWTFVTGVVSLCIFSVLITEQWRLSLLVVGAVTGLCLAVYGLIYLKVRWIKASKFRLSVYMGAPTQTALQVTALALGLSMMAVLLVLREDLGSGWQKQLPANTPNQFVYGLPPFELERFQQQIQHNQWQASAMYPNIRARLIKKNGQAFSKQVVSQNNALRRELNLTQTAVYPADNLVVQGNPRLTQPGEVSVEFELAQALNIHIGDQLSFSLPEGNINARVVNLRKVEWQSFSPNFFFIFAPKTLDENAGSYLGSFYVPPQDKAKMVALIEQFPNTTMIDVGLILDEVKRLIQVLLQVLTVLASLVAIAGVLVLLACINLLLDQRKKEVALQRSFGASKAKLKNMLSVEFALLGAMAGGVACLLAEILAALLAQRMNMTLHWHGVIWLTLPICMALVSALIARYRLSYLCELAPLKSLRELD